MSITSSPPQHKKPSKDDITLSVQDLTKAADRLLNDDKEAPSVEALADGLSTSLGRGLSDGPGGIQERKQRFGANKLPSRKEVCHQAIGARQKYICLIMGFVSL